MKPWAYLRPHPSFHQAKNGYLLYHGRYHSVECMTSSMFKSIVLASHPTFSQSEAYKQPYLDVTDRWYILTRYPLKLFKKGDINENLTQKA